MLKRKAIQMCSTRNRKEANPELVPKQARAAEVAPVVAESAASAEAEATRKAKETPFGCSCPTPQVATVVEAQVTAEAAVAEVSAVPEMAAEVQEKVAEVKVVMAMVDTAKAAAVKETAARVTAAEGWV